MDSRVWILGAGASKSATCGVFPTLLSLVPTARRLGLFEQWRGTIGHEELASYVSRKFAVTLSRSTELNLEDVLTNLDVDIAVDPKPQLLLARQHLLKMLQHTISYLQDSLTSPASEYIDFAARLEPSTTVITFNWDLLLDDALGRKFRLDQKDPSGGDRWTDGQYGSFLWNFTGYGDRTYAKMLPAPPTSSWPGTRGWYLKAHGSIDWRLCENQSCRNYVRLFPVKDALAEPFCSECLETTNLLLVPPTLNKRLREYPTIRRLWTTAAKELECASEVVLWGYSLPPTDFYSSWLLRHVSASQLNSITIVNPEVVRGGRGKVRLNIEYVSRLVPRSKFKDKAFNLRLFESYQDFVAGCELELKYPSLKNSLNKLRTRFAKV